MKQRFITLDIIRGIALFGILLINIPAYVTVTESNLLPSMSAGTTIDLFITVLVEKKFYAMFSFLFGVGFYIFATNAEQKGKKPLRLFTRRLFFMLLFGVVHFIFFWGTILPIYAVLGLILLPFYRRQPTTILAAMALLFIVNCITPHDEFIIVLLFLTGLWFAKKQYLHNTLQTQQFLRRVLLLTLPITVAGGALIGITYGNDVAFTMYAVGAFAPIMTATYLAALFLIFQQPTAAAAATPIARVGQMAFTNYLMQNVLGVALLALFGITVVTPTEVLWLAPLIYGIEMLWSWLYFKRFRMGPFEWLWRKCTYGRGFTLT